MQHDALQKVTVNLSQDVYNILTQNYIFKLYLCKNVL